MTKSKILGLLSLPILFSAVLLVGLTIAHIATAPPIEDVVCLIAATTCGSGCHLTTKKINTKKVKEPGNFFLTLFFYAASSAITSLNESL